MIAEVNYWKLKWYIQHIPPVKPQEVYLRLQQGVNETTGVYQTARSCIYAEFNHIIMWYVDL